MGSVYIGLGDPRTPAFPSIGDLFKEKTEQDVVLFVQHLGKTEIKITVVR